MKLGFIVLKPSSKPKEVLYPTTKPDVENLRKNLLDIPFGLIYSDDSQVVDLHA